MQFAFCFGGGNGSGSGDMGPGQPLDCGRDEQECHDDHGAGAYCMPKNVPCPVDHGDGSGDGSGGDGEGSGSGDYNVDCSSRDAMACKSDMQRCSKCTAPD